MIKTCLTCKEKFVLDLHVQHRSQKFCSRSCIRNRTQFTKGSRPWNKGRKWDEMSARRVGSGNPMFGKRYSTEQRHLISERAKINGYGKWMIGRRWSPEQKQNFKRAVIARFDKLGRKTKRERTILVGREEYKKWREAVFKRDSWTCQECGRHGCYLEAHHIKSWARFPEDRYDVGNGITLCKSCHKLTDNYAGKSKT